MRNFYVLIVLILLSNGPAYGQFEGKIVYDVNYKSDDPSIDDFISFLPGESSLTIQGSKSRFEQHVTGGGKQVFVSDASTESGTLMLNFLGQEYQVKLSADSMQLLRQNTSLRIIETEGTKEILGYKCRKALGINGTDTLTIYYSEELQHNAFMPQFTHIRGMPMEYEMIQNNLHMHFIAKSVDLGPVPPEAFTISSKVREISFQDFARAFAVKAREE